MRQCISEIDFEQFVKNTMYAVFLLKEKEILFMNPAACNLLGVQSIDDLENLNFHHYLHPDFHYICYKRLEKIMRQLETAEIMDQKFLTVDREIIDVEVMGIPYLHHTGEVWAQVVCRDISKRIHVENQLRDFEKLSVIGEISAGIVHEIKNPLTSVKGFVQLLKNEMTHSYLGIIEKELDDALTTLESLLHISRPDLDAEPYLKLSLNKEIDDILLLFQDQKYNIMIKKEEASQIVIMGKRNLLKKAFFNLIKNAIESIDGEGEVAIKLYKDDHWNIIEITDTGVGIPRNKLAKLGTPFFTTKLEGTGMGLTQVFNTIKLHHGHVDVNSELGQGTTFRIHLPFM